MSYSAWPTLTWKADLSIGEYIIKDLDLNRCSSPANLKLQRVSDLSEKPDTGDWVAKDGAGLA